MKLGWIISFAIVVSTWYFIIMPNVPPTPIGYYGAVNSPMMDLGILILVTMLMLLVIVLKQMEHKVC